MLASFFTYIVFRLESSRFQYMNYEVAVGDPVDVVGVLMLLEIVREGIICDSGTGDSGSDTRQK